MTPEQVRQEIGELMDKGVIKSEQDVAEYIARKAEEAVCNSSLLSRVSNEQEMGYVILTETAMIAAAIDNFELGLKLLLAAIAVMDIDRLNSLIPSLGTTAELEIVAV